MSCVFHDLIKDLFVYCFFFFSSRGGLFPCEGGNCNDLISIHMCLITIHMCDVSDCILLIHFWRWGLESLASCLRKTEEGIDLLGPLLLYIFESQSTDNIPGGGDSPVTFGGPTET